MGAGGGMTDYINIRKAPYPGWYLLNGIVHMLTSNKGRNVVGTACDPHNGIIIEEREENGWCVGRPERGDYVCKTCSEILIGLWDKRVDLERKPPTGDVDA